MQTDPAHRCHLRRDAHATLTRDRNGAVAAPPLVGIMPPDPRGNLSSRVLFLIPKRKESDLKRILSGGCHQALSATSAEGVIVNIFTCHCTECQKQSGSAFGMTLSLQEGGLRRLSGDLRQWIRRLPSNQNLLCEFCALCGTRVYHTSDSNRAAGTLSIKPGTLDETSWLKPFAHLWTDRAQPWITIAPGQIRYARNPSRFASERLALPDCEIS